MTCTPSRLHACRQCAGLWTISFLAAVALCAAAPVDAAEIDLSKAVVLAPVDVPVPERQAVRVLIEEVEKRTGIRWQETQTVPEGTSAVIALGTSKSLAPIAGRFAEQVASRKDFQAAEGYRFRTVGGESPAVLLVGNDSRGVLFAAGRLLRTLRMTSGKVSVADGIDIATAPDVKMRGHQLGYRPKTNSYDAWSVPIWDQYIRDLAVFGANAIELVPPRTDDDATSPHSTLPQLEMMVEMSKICEKYGLDVWIWYPALDKDYGDAATVEFALKEWEVVFKALPKIDAIFVPGGDPGHTHPKHMLPLLEKQTESLHRHHPHAQMWMSPQGFDTEWMDIFYGMLERDKPTWLSGVVHGPQVRASVPELRAKIPAQYPIRMYPDITHSRQCQYPVPNWDVAFAITEGREGVNPRPVGHAHLLRTLAPHSVGFISYSEGCNDDVNKFVWSGIGWDLDADVTAVLREYSRYFVGEQYADTLAQGLIALEKNWDGPAITNHTIPTTLQQFQGMERSASPEVLANWRFQQPLYRAYYDSYIRDRLLYETALESLAREKLAAARASGSLVAMEDAEKILERAVSEPVAVEKRTHIFALGDALFQSIKMQLSVKRHKAIAAERGANLDTIDTCLNNRKWLIQQFKEIRSLNDENQRIAAIDEIVNWTDPGPGGFYDDLGNPARQPHLVRGKGFQGDPESFESPRIGYVIGEPFFTIYPQSWLQNAEALYDGAVRVHYDQLDPSAHYKVKVSYAGDAGRAKMKLLADEKIEVHSLIVKGFPAPKREFDIPREATADGKLTLTWFAEPGLGRNGRACQVAEVWLIRK
ncbi:MAG: hypothetical protein AB7O26_11520 [Planctomycetaceae bacterium]